VNVRADTNYITLGQCTMIRWDVDNVAAVYLADGNTVQGVGGHGARSVCSRATSTYAVRVVGRDGITTDYPVTINVTPGAVTISFSADATTINQGQCTTLRWNTTNAQAIYLNQGAGEALVGPEAAIPTCPGTTSTYTLRVVRPDGGSESRQFVITVNKPPPPGPSITTFNANPNQIFTGQCVTISWNTSNASTVSLFRSGSAVVTNGAPDGSFKDCLANAGFYDYTLLALGNGQTFQKLGVSVRAPIVPS
jgi:hypothetical protein